MDEQLVRQLVRQAIARHAGAGAPLAPAPAPAAAPPAAPAALGHPSALRFQLVRASGDTECLIEPTVTCNHCGHCQCYGH